MKIMKRILRVLFLLIVFSSSCLAADEEFITSRLRQYAEYKSLATSLAFAVQDQCAREEDMFHRANPKDEEYESIIIGYKFRKNEYLHVRQAYQNATAQFDAWRAIFALEIINKGRLPTDSIYYSEIPGKSFEAFQKLAVEYIDKGKRSNDLSLVGYVLNSFIFPGMSKILEIQKQSEDIQKERRTNLLLWLDKYYKWDNWNSFAPQPKPN
jgi:hypothetical protein